MAKKKKKKLGLVYASLILILLIAIYAVMSMTGVGESEDETKEIESAATTILELDTDTIRKLSFTNSAGKEVTLVKEEDVWYYKEDKAFPVLQDTVETLLSNLAAIESYHELTDIDNLEDFGLSEPMRIIHIEDTEGNVTNIHIGNVNKTTGYYYIYLDDKTHLFTIAPTIPAAFDIELYDLVEAEAFPTIDSTAIGHVSMELEDSIIDINAYKVDSTTTYTIAKDGEEEKVADDTNISTLLTSLTSISYNSCVDYAADDLSIYGLDNPTATVTIDYTETYEEVLNDTNDETDETSTDETKTITVDAQAVLYIGAVYVPEEKMKETEAETSEDEVEMDTKTEEETLYYYVRLEGSHQISLVSEELLEDIFSIDVNNYLNTYISNISFADLDSFKVVYGGEEYEIYAETHKEVSFVEAETTDESLAETETETKITEVTTCYVNGIEVDYTTLAAFYTNVADMLAESYTDEITLLEGEPLFTFIFHLSDKSQMILRYYTYNSSFYAVETEGLSRIALVNKLDVLAMLASFEDLMALIK